MPRGMFVILILLAVLAVAVTGLAIADMFRHPVVVPVPQGTSSPAPSSNNPTAHFPDALNPSSSTANPSIDGGTRFPVVSATGTTIGSLLADATFSDINGNAIMVSGYRGQKAVILFGWDIRCSTCTSELLALADMQDDFRSALEVVVLTRRESIASIRGEIDRLNLGSKLRVVVDPTGSYWEGLGDLPSPFTFFVNVNGIIVHKEKALVTISMLRSLVNQYFGLSK